MISYAVSMSALGEGLTDAYFNAFRDSKIKNIEVTLRDFLDENQNASANLTRFEHMLSEKVIQIESSHIPFYPSADWEISLSDETKRKKVVENFKTFLKKYPILFRKNITVHASMEPIRDDERAGRIQAACRSIEELLPITTAMGLSFNVEFLPRTCIGNKEADLLKIMSAFAPSEVGICMDVNHVMSRNAELPEIIETLAPRIRTFHISDFDGVDERHWFVGQGLIDWRKVMKKIKAIDHDVVMIFETGAALTGTEYGRKASDPAFALKQTAWEVFYLENCETLQPQSEAFRVPGN